MMEASWEGRWRKVSSSLYVRPVASGTTRSQSQSAVRATIPLRRRPAVARTGPIIHDRCIHRDCDALHQTCRSQVAAAAAAAAGAWPTRRAMPCFSAPGAGGTRTDQSGPAGAMPMRHQHTHGGCAPVSARDPRRRCRPAVHQQKSLPVSLWWARSDSS